NENDTRAYISAVTRAMGVSPDTRMSDLTHAQRAAMVNAMAHHEGYRGGLFSLAEARAVTPENLGHVPVGLSIPAVPGIDDVPPVAQDIFYTPLGPVVAPTPAQRDIPVPTPAPRGLPDVPVAAPSISPATLAPPD